MSSGEMSGYAKRRNDKKGKEEECHEDFINSFGVGQGTGTVIVEAKMRIQ